MVATWFGELAGLGAWLVGAVLEGAASDGLGEVCPASAVCLELRLNAAAT